MCMRLSKQRSVKAVETVKQLSKMYRCCCKKNCCINFPPYLDIQVSRSVAEGSGFRHRPELVHCNKMTEVRNLFEKLRITAKNLSLVIVSMFPANCYLIANGFKPCSVTDAVLPQPRSTYNYLRLLFQPDLFWQPRVLLSHIEFGLVAVYSDFPTNLRRAWCVVGSGLSFKKACWQD